MDKRLYEYIRLKKYLQQTGKTLDYSPEELYNITYNDKQKILQLLNITPRLAPNTPIHPINNTIHSDPINFHNPKINNYIMNTKLSSYDNHFINQNTPLINYIKQSPYYCNEYINNGHQLINTSLYYPDHTKKSIGYNQLCQHNFNLIDMDYQSPYHTVPVFPFGGESTRLENKINKQDNKYIKC